MQAFNEHFYQHNLNHERPKKKPCCVCKMTKKIRDNCIRNNDEDICFAFVRAHK